MFRRTSPRRDARPTRRRGAILLVVLTMLALFAVIGLSFVLYAESEANAARVSKAAVNTDLGLPETSGAVNGFLEQMLFQPDKRESALWGNELSRLMYGNAQAQPGNTTPYNGVGVYSEMLNPKFNGVSVPMHRTQFVRFGKYFYNPLAPTQYVRVLPDQTYADPTGYVEDGVTPLPMGATLKDVGRNAPYTYADRNNIYVAVQDPATGRIVKPSYHAPSLFRSSYIAALTIFYDLEPANPNWYTPQGYFQLLRPRPVDHLTTEEMNYLAGLSPSLWPIPTVIDLAKAQTLYTILSGNDSAAPISFKRAFPFVAANPDGSFTGDVQNVRGTENQQAFDSVWLDLKLPVITYRGTRRLQPMIAATVLPLDGRINYNVASVTGSNQGFGPSEINLSKVLPAATAAEMVKQRFGTATVAPVPSGSTNLYDYFHADPSAPALATSATYPPSYSAVDFTGIGGAQPAAPTNFATSYTYLNTTYNSGNGSAAYKQPPLYFNPFQWNPLTTTGRADGSLTPLRGNQFPLADARYLEARYSAKPKTTQDSTNLGNFDANGPVALGLSNSTPKHPANRARALLTPESNRLARPGLAPIALGNLVPASGVGTNAGTLALALPASPAPGVVNLSPSLQDPTLAPNPAGNVGSRLDLSPGQLLAAAAGAPNSLVGGDIPSDLNTKAANLRAILQGVDLNRPLADYRDPASRPPVSAMDQNWLFVPGADTVPPATAPVFPTTVTPKSFQRATAERQALATDIFTRLCVALNARVYYTGTGFTGLNLPQAAPAGSPAPYVLKDNGTQSWNVSQAEYDALRWVAQLSANIVDAIDPDDVSTRFVWNPDPAAGFDPAAASNYLTGAGVVGGLNDRVVFGVEKPKLLVNEVYAEVANVVGDYAKTELTGGDKFTVRFFVELLNPSNAEGTPGVDQGARSGGNARLQFPANAALPAFSSYRIQVYDTGLALHNELTSTTNAGYVLGQPTTAVPKLQATFDGTMVPTSGPPTNAFVVEPNNGRFGASATPPMSRHGFCVVGPKLDSTKTETPPTAYAPQQADATKVDSFMLPKLPVAGPAIPDQLEYDSPVAAVDSDVIKDQVVKPLNQNDLHAVVLQRLANPYWPENASPYNQASGPYNPYITVDYMAGVEVHDGIRIGKKKPGDPNGTRTTTPATPDQNFAIGRAQPYVGFQSQAAITAPVAVLTEASAPTPPLGQTLSVLQNSSVAPVAPSSPTRTTFFRHNSLAVPTTVTPNVTFPPPPAGTTETLILPFTEPFQPDRRLINPLEVLHLSMAPSHLLTRNFATPNGTNPYVAATPTNFYQQELSRVAFTPPATMMPAPPAVSPLLYRALEVLNVKPWTYGIPHAGRTPGGININAIWDDVNAPASPPVPGDSAVFNALLDPQPANFFTQGTISSTPAVAGSPGTPKIFGIWERLRTSRSPAWTSGPNQQWVGATVDEVIDASTTPPTRGTDRPFKGFGVGQYDTTSGGMASPQGLESTLLRSDPTTGVPLFFNTAGQTDPYRQAEPLRKAFNNLTTVSDNYLVVFTVGFFDIDLPSYQQSPSRVVLRREAYEQVPGDLRAQFTAVIDRSGLAVDANNPGSGQTGKFAQASAATSVEALPPRVVGVNSFNRYRVRFQADSSDGLSPPTKIFVRDMPTANGSLFTVQVGSNIRLGSGPTAANFTVSQLGGVINSGGAPADPRDITPANAFDPSTGLATVTLEVPAGGQPPVCAAGDLICLPDNELANNNTVFIPGNPGKVSGFSPADPRFRGVVRYFGRMQP